MTKRSFTYLFALSLLLGATPSLAQNNMGYLKIDADPGRAGVFVDGDYVGPASNFKKDRRYPVAPGQHEVTLRDSLHEDFTTTVQIRAGETTNLRQELTPVAPAQPPFGTLRIQHPDKFAAVYVNGKYMGHADEFNNRWQGLLLNPGEYEVRVEPASGGNVLSETVTIRANQKTTVRP